MQRPERVELAGLTARVVGPADAPLTVVLFHGFGAPGDDLVSLAGALSARARFVFPAAPIELGGLYGDSRAWWRLDLAQLERDLGSGAVRDRRAEIPEGLAEARAQVAAALAALARMQPAHPAGGKLVLGGFSQGAMIALDAALHADAAPAGLALMSGTLIAAADWTPRMPRLTGVPVMLSHGRHDPLLPFSIAEHLRDELLAVGATVDWQPFAGAHEIPAPVVRALDALLLKLA